MVPYPHELRKDVSADSIQKLLDREFMEKAVSQEDKLVELARWALSYVDAFEKQKVLTDEIHFEALRTDEALRQCHATADILNEDTGSTLRLLGASIQQVKVSLELGFIVDVDLIFCAIFRPFGRPHTPRLLRGASGTISSPRRRPSLLMKECIRRQVALWTRISRGQLAITCTFNSYCGGCAFYGQFFK